MKFGFRKPSIKKSIKARTTGKIKRKLKKSVNPFYGKKGMGYIKNPKKAVYNKVYNKTTVGVNDIMKFNMDLGSNNSKTDSNNSKINSNDSKIDNNDKKISKNSVVILFLIFFFPVGLYLMWKKTNWNKIVKIIITAFFVIYLFFIVVNLGSASEDTNSNSVNATTNSVAQTTELNIESFQFVNDDTIELELNGYKNEKNSYFWVTSKEEFSIDDIEFVSENPEVATFTYDKTALTNYVYYNVTAVSAGETYIYVQTKDKTVTSEKIKVVVTELETTTETTVTTTTEEVTEEVAEIKSGITVYTTPSGKKYHYSKDCAGDNAIEHDLDDVQGSYEPCKKCAQ